MQDNNHIFRDSQYLLINSNSNNSNSNNYYNNKRYMHNSKLCKLNNR